VKILFLEFYGKVYLDCGFPLVAYITRHSLENLGLEEGKEGEGVLQGHGHSCGEKESEIINAKWSVKSVNRQEVK